MTSIWTGGLPLASTSHAGQTGRLSDIPIFARSLASVHPILLRCQAHVADGLQHGSLATESCLTAQSQPWLRTALVTFSANFKHVPKGNVPFTPSAASKIRRRRVVAPSGLRLYLHQPKLHVAASRVGIHRVHHLKICRAPTVQTMTPLPGLRYDQSA